MIAVIQCAASKKPNAGHLQRRDGRKVLFVADPESAPADVSHVYARPDDMADSGRSWRDELLSYNDAPGNNPLGLLPAWQLYENETYALLAERYGVDRLYILSAGWGLLSSDFLTPKYDITFSAQADAYKRRRKKDRYNDLRMLPPDTDEPAVFFVSRGYVQLARTLTEGLRGPRHLFYNSTTPPDAPGFILNAYETRTRTNWQYECAKSLLAGNIEI
ncbi:hypothetical protein [Parvibaculum sp.]|uniref:hypothetical protein n=1 Tax=Parvibaculum sp. TaxID=2024848 RepID=UPI000C5408B9|nr:hypothetical protein [Parvibaculum sp.]MAM93324.1 hypothetical protein [Parvibaculum sp.]|tara:strand:- start:11737 stop:12390 length:654 start_codon:yes stop_codon:yes gene_type:complete